nr:MAG TPA: hypothetical protein [Caudoviricetes sp.]
MRNQPAILATIFNCCPQYRRCYGTYGRFSTTSFKL